MSKMYLIYSLGFGWNNHKIEFEYLVDNESKASSDIEQLNAHQMKLLKFAEEIESVMNDWTPIDDYYFKYEPLLIEITDDMSQEDIIEYQKWNQQLDLEYFMDDNNDLWEYEDQLLENLISQYPYQDELRDILKFDSEAKDGIKQYHVKVLEVK